MNTTECDCYQESNWTTTWSPWWLMRLVLFTILIQILLYYTCHVHKKQQPQKPKIDKECQVEIQVSSNDSQVQVSPKLCDVLNVSGECEQYVNRTISDLRELCGKIHGNLKDTKSFIEPNDSVEQLPPWCCCGNCRVMKSEKENICCQDTNCITKSDAYQCLLGENILSTAICHKEEITTNLNPSNGFDESYLQDQRRRKLYQKYTEWQHGQLGKHNRIPIPSCVVFIIRAVYPSADGRYTGFQSVETVM